MAHPQFLGDGQLVTQEFLQDALHVDAMDTEIMNAIASLTKKVRCTELLWLFPALVSSVSYSDSS